MDVFFFFSFFSSKLDKVWWKTSILQEMYVFFSLSRVCLFGLLYFVFLRCCYLLCLATWRYLLRGVFTCLSVCLYLSVFICPPVCLSVRLSCFIYPSTHVAVYSYLFMPLYMYIYLSLPLSLCSLFVCVSVSASVYVYLQRFILPSFPIKAASGVSPCIGNW